MSNNIQSPFQMTGVKTLNFKYKTPDGDMKGLKPQHPQIRYEIIEVGVADDFRIGRLMLDITVRIGPPRKAISIEYKLKAGFRCGEKNIDEEKFIGMIKLNGLASLLALARGHITAVTATLGLSPGYIMPLINVHELIRNAEDRAQTD